MQGLLNIGGEGRARGGLRAGKEAREDAGFRVRLQPVKTALGQETAAMRVRAV
jgi:hypothetical protein